MNVAVIGTGYVGLVTGTCLADHGHHVVCVDAVQEKIDALNKGQIPIWEPGLDQLVQRNAAQGRLRFTTNTAAAVQASEIVMIAVGTPPGEDGSADLTYVLDAARTVAHAANGYKVVVIKSTVPVGTGDRVEVLMAGLTNHPVDVVSNPEFLREGSAVHDALHPDRIVIGTDSERAAAIMRELYASIDAPILVTHRRSSEMIKYAANAFLSVKISFINEIAGLCERLDADIEEVAWGIGLDKRIGGAFLKAGLGFGGSCFPKDTSALIRMAEEVGYTVPVVQAAVAVNHRQREVMVAKVRAALGTLRGKRIGMLGIAFKPNTDDVREAASLHLMKLLTAEGATVAAYDPVALETGRWAWRAQASPETAEAVVFCESAEATADQADALILVTEWPAFAELDWAAIYRRMKQPYLFDGRNLLDPAEMRRTGFKYVGVGRGAGAP